MKNIALLFSLSIAAVVSNGANAQYTDTVTMGQGYANSVYFNLRNGEKTTAPMAQWHIAHTTVTRDNCLRINHMAGFEVYAYPNGDNKDFSTMDTAGWKSWRKFYNDIHEHEKGAFNQQKTSMWDFSWGVYDPNTKEVTGDSLYLLVNAVPGFNTTYLKFMPIKQLVTGDFIYRIATLDGSTDRTDTMFQSSGKDKSYKYQHFYNGSVQPEPVRNNWDLLFTRYPAPTVPPGGGPTVMYPTMGIESKRGTRVSKITNVSWSDWTDFFSNYSNKVDSALTAGNGLTLSKDLTKIGGDWKTFNGSNGTWTIENQWVYIVESVRTYPSGNDTAIYFVNMEKFSGSSKGETILNRYLLSKIPGSVKSDKSLNAEIYPNPATQALYVKLPLNHGKTLAILHDAQGKSMMRAEIIGNGSDYYSFNTSNLTPGIYTLVLTDGSGNSGSYRFVKVQ